MINRDALNGLRNRFNGQEIAKRFLLHTSDHSDDMVLTDTLTGKMTTVPINSIKTVTTVLGNLFEEAEYIPNDQLDKNELLLEYKDTTGEHDMRTIFTINKETQERNQWTLDEIIEEINADRHEDWEDVDHTDWIEGLLYFTEYALEVRKGDTFYWTDPDDDLCSGVVTSLEDKLLCGEDSLEDIVISGVEVLSTDKGDMLVSELSLPLLVLK